MDLLVSHDCGHFGRARHEMLTVLRRLGDDHAQVRRSGVDGIALVHTTLDARAVVRRCRQLQQANFTFEFAIKWVPVDYWCDTDLHAIRALLESKVCDQIAAGKTWAMQVAKHRWQQYQTRDIIANLAPAITRKVDLSHPDKLLRIDVLGPQTAISVLNADEIFSVRQQPAARSSEPLAVQHSPSPPTAR
jgi:tRNA(Ser,Leu) C12 N-acetylase TAN1